jgi:hypothetical protein
VIDLGTGFAETTAMVSAGTRSGESGGGGKLSWDVIVWDRGCNFILEI